MSRLRVSPKLLYVATGLVAVLGAGAVYLQFSALGDEEAKVAALRTQARDEKEIRAELAKIGGEVGVLQSKLRNLEAGVPPFAYIPTMARELEAAGKRAQIEVLGVRPMPDPPKKDPKTGEIKKSDGAYEEMTIQVKGRGSYASVARFVRSLTVFPKIVAVRMLTLNPKADSQDPFAAPKLDADIEIRAYAFKDALPAASVSPVAPPGPPAPKAKPAVKSPRFASATPPESPASPALQPGGTRNGS